MSTNIRAVILAAGKGTRMKSEKSKVLHKLFEKELLGYVLDASFGVENLDKSYVIVGHQAELVEKFVQENYADNTKCLLQQPQLGTGDAVAKALNDLKGFDGKVLILCGDTPLITAQTLQKFVDASENSDLTVMSAIFENPTGYGRIVKDEQGRLVKIIEQKDASEQEKTIKEVNAGIYCLDWQKIEPAFSCLKNDNAQGEYYLTDIIAWAVKEGLKTSSYVLENNEEIFGINSKTHLAQAFSMLNQRTIQKMLDEGVEIMSPETTWISPFTTIGADTVIYPSTFINGKNIIGKNCKIGPFAHLRGGCEIADCVKIGNFVELKKTKVASNTNVCHLSYVGDSELGQNVNIGAGTITANYDHITKKKSQTKIENGVSIGSNSVLVAPVTIEENASVGALSVITKNVDKNSLAITRSPLKIFKDWVLDRKKNN
ncbi:bifunctional N-acetylglucosamine-1-phosphate uridyltransferase/glucosamine-1-phosphate acetyltransferase [bacterium]|nr:bifunctional N-acetylglucosamine-1-phosphate uridyltransferase/glucosamine-1-phosphate acetyltransferase [bacterium]